MRRRYRNATRTVVVKLIVEDAETGEVLVTQESAPVTVVMTDGVHFHAHTSLTEGVANRLIGEFEVNYEEPLSR